MLLRNVKLILFHVDGVIAEKIVLQEYKCIARCCLRVAFIVNQRKITTQSSEMYMKNAVRVSLSMRDNSATDPHH